MCFFFCITSNLQALCKTVMSQEMVTRPLWGSYAARRFFSIEKAIRFTSGVWSEVRISYRKNAQKNNMEPENGGCLLKSFVFSPGQEASQSWSQFSELYCLDLVWSCVTSLFESSIYIYIYYVNIMVNTYIYIWLIVTSISTSRTISFEGCSCGTLRHPGWCWP